MSSPFSEYFESLVKMTMCDICLHSPCLSRCPNATPKVVFICSGCGVYIEEGQDYWDVLGEQFCERCINGMKSVAEVVDDDFD